MPSWTNQRRQRSFYQHSWLLPLQLLGHFFVVEQLFGRFRNVQRPCQDGLRPSGAKKRWLVGKRVDSVQRDIGRGDLGSEGYVSGAGDRVFERISRHIEGGKHVAVHLFFYKFLSIFFFEK